MYGQKWAKKVLEGYLVSGSINGKVEEMYRSSSKINIKANKWGIGRSISRQVYVD